LVRVERSFIVVENKAIRPIRICRTLEQVPDDLLLTSARPLAFAFPACCSDAEFLTDFQSALFCGNLEERVSVAVGHISSGHAPARPVRAA
jgi:hypothetical protein